MLIPCRGPNSEALKKQDDHVQGCSLYTPGTKGMNWVNKAVNSPIFPKMAIIYL